MILLLKSLLLWFYLTTLIAIVICCVGSRVSCIYEPMMKYFYSDRRGLMHDDSAPSTWHEGWLNRFISTESTDSSTVAEILIEPLSSIWNNGGHPHTMLFILFYFFVSCLWFWIELYRQAIVSCLKKKIHRILHDVWNIYTFEFLWECETGWFGAMLYWKSFLWHIVHETTLHQNYFKPMWKLFVSVITLEFGLTTALHAY